MRRQRNTLTAVLLLFFCLPAFADDDYVHISAGTTVVDTYNPGILLVATYGVKTPVWHKYLSLETEVTSTLISPGKSAMDKFTYYSAGEYLVYTLPFTANTSIRARAGVSYVVNERPQSESAIKAGIGFGMTYKMTENKKLLLEFTDIDNISHFTLGLQLNY